MTSMAKRQAGSAGSQPRRVPSATRPREVVGSSRNLVAAMAPSMPVEPSSCCLILGLGSVAAVLLCMHAHCLKSTKRLALLEADMVWDGTRHRSLQTGSNAARPGADG